MATVATKGAVSELSPPKIKWSALGDLAQQRIKGESLTVRRIYLSGRGTAVAGQILFLPADKYDSVVEGALSHGAQDEEVPEKVGKRPRIAWNTNSETLFVRVADKGSDAITPSFQTTREEQLRIAARVFLHLRIAHLRNARLEPVERLKQAARIARDCLGSNNSDLTFESYKRAARIALDCIGSKNNKAITNAEVLDYYIKEDEETFINACIALNETEPTTVECAFYNVLDGKLPSGKDKIPEDEKDRYEKLADDLSDSIDRNSPPDYQTLQINLPLPKTHPSYKKEWNRTAYEIMGKESVHTQAKRISEIYKLREFTDDLLKSSPLDLTNWVSEGRSKIQRTKEQKYVHYVRQYQEKTSSNHSLGWSMRFRWHTKTNDRNNEVPNYRIKRIMGDTAEEFLKITEDSPLRDKDLREALGIKTEPAKKKDSSKGSGEISEEYWIPVDRFGVWVIPGISVDENGKRQLKYVELKYGDNKRISREELFQALIDAGHITNVPKGFDCTTQSNTLENEIKSNRSQKGKRK